MHISIERDKLKEITEQMCDYYCKWPFNTGDQAELNKICEKCPLNSLPENEWPLGYNPYQE